MEVKAFNKIQKNLFISILFLNLLQCAPAVPSIFGEIHDEYLHKLVRNTKSSEMTNYLNVNGDPCTNFYDFVCGNYQRINPPNDFMANNVFQDLSENMYRKYMTLIQHNDTTDTLNEMKIKNFYESCTNLAILRNTYRTKLREIINEFGQMPAIEDDNWRDSKYFDWLKTIALINRKYGKIIILGAEVQSDLNNKKLHTVYITQQEAPLGSAEAYTESDEEPARQMRRLNIVNNLKHMFGLRTAVAENTAREIFEFERHLFAGHQDVNKTGSSCAVEPVCIDDIQKTNKSEMIDIERLKQLTFGYVPNHNVYNFDFSSMAHIYETIKRTQIRIVANYIFYTLIENFLLIQNPVEQKMENFMILTSMKRKHELEKVCIKETEKHFSEFLTNMFYRKYMSNETELNLKPLWDNIKLSFQGILDTHRHKGMKDIYQITSQKLQSMKLIIRSYNEINFAEKFDALSLGKHDYLENLKAVLVNQAELSRAKLNKTSTRMHFETAIDRKPVYSFTENVIAVPVSLLQPYYLWSDSYPAALKYATIGFLIARQLVHTLQYYAFDKWGNFHTNRLQYTDVYFSNISPCFEMQYRSYYIDGRPLPKLKSSIENIADTGAIRVAFNAYLRWLAQAPPKELLDEQMTNLNYTNAQLFFISFGQMLCSAGHDLTESINNFAVEPYRVNQALSNLEDFSKHYECSESSTMNPLTKCKIY